MTASKIRSSVLSERISWIREMLENILNLPLDSYDAFISDSRNSASAESYLRRALEALMDTGINYQALWKKPVEKLLNLSH